MDCSLIGENGADIWVTSTMPPVRLPSELSADEVEALRSLRHAVDSRYGDKVFFQPNAVGVTAFPRCDTLTPAQVEREVNVQLPETISTYIHIDSVDWAVKRFNKGIALQRLAQHLGIPISRVAAAGDGANDLPMLAIASLALWLGDADDASGVTVERVGTVDRMMERLIGFAHEV